MHPLYVLIASFHEQGVFLVPSGNFMIDVDTGFQHHLTALAQKEISIWKKNFDILGVDRIFITI